MQRADGILSAPLGHHFDAPVVLAVAGNPGAPVGRSCEGDKIMTLLRLQMSIDFLFSICKISMFAYNSVLRLYA